MHSLEPTEVADAIVEALQLGTVDVWVPKSAKRTNVLGAVLPRPLSEGMARAMKADRVLAARTAAAGAHYELRAARSEPGLEPRPERQQITQARASEEEAAQVAGPSVAAQVAGVEEGLS